MTDSSFLMNSG